MSKRNTDIFKYLNLKRDWKSGSIAVSKHFGWGGGGGVRAAPTLSGLGFVYSSPAMATRPWDTEGNALHLWNPILAPEWPDGWKSYLGKAHESQKVFNPEHVVSMS